MDDSQVMRRLVAYHERVLRQDDGLDHDEVRVLALRRAREEMRTDDEDRARLTRLVIESGLHMKRWKNLERWQRRKM